MMVITQEMLPPAPRHPWLGRVGLGVRSVAHPAPTARRVRAVWLIRSLRGQR